MFPSTTISTLLSSQGRIAVDLVIYNDAPALKRGPSGRKLAQTILRRRRLGRVAASTTSTLQPGFRLTVLEPKRLLVRLDELEPKKQGHPRKNVAVSGGLPAYLRAFRRWNEARNLVHHSSKQSVFIA